jgi:hypothetical protein
VPSWKRLFKLSRFFLREKIFIYLIFSSLILLSNTVIAASLFGIGDYGRAYGYDISSGQKVGNVYSSFLNQGGGLIFSASVVPIPPALSLFGSGLAILGFVGWRRKRKIAAA